jgi:hypothetical protein
MRKRVILPVALFTVSVLTVTTLLNRFLLPLVLELEPTFPVLKTVWMLLNTGTI